MVLAAFSRPAPAKSPAVAEATTAGPSLATASAPLTIPATKDLTGLVNGEATVATSAIVPMLARTLSLVDCPNIDCNQYPAI